MSDRPAFAGVAGPVVEQVDPRPGVVHRDDVQESVPIQVCGLQEGDAVLEREGLGTGEAERGWRTGDRSAGEEESGE